MIPWFKKQSPANGGKQANLTGLSLTRKTKSRSFPAAEQRRRVSDKPVTKRYMKALYAKPRSFTNVLPWLEYLADTQCFLLDDGVSVGALFDIEPIATEGRTETFLVELRDKLQTVLTAMPEEQGSQPWIVQFYLQDEPYLQGLFEQICAYAQPRAQETALTQAYLKTLEAHFQMISQPGGLFKTVRSPAALGGVRTVRCA